MSSGVVVAEGPKGNVSVSSCVVRVVVLVGVNCEEVDGSALGRGL